MPAKRMLATAKEERWKTVTRQPDSPTAQITQARRASVAAPKPDHPGVTPGRE